jgi:biopolymer transport protein ExbD
MNFRKRGRRPATQIDLTPLIDVVFQLLIFFLITTTFVQNPGIEVDLPKATTAQVAQDGEQVIVGVTKDGRYVHQGRAVSDDELEEALKARMPTSPDRAPVMVIQADEGTPHGKVVHVMDLARRLGYGQLAIATLQP